jgi:phage gpG-like protein
MRLTIEILGGEKVDVALSRFGDYARDLRPFWLDAFAPSFYADQQKNFEGRGSYVGGWAPLSPRYAAYKSKVRPGRPLMEFNGTLRASLKGKDEPFAVFRPAQQSLQIGTSVPYAARHQTGGGRLPQRRVIWLASSQTYGRVMHTWAIKQAKKAGLNAA